MLDGVREQGYGEDNEEQEEGLRCIGVPVFDRFGVVIAGLSISFQRYVSLKNACMNTWRCSIRRRVRFLNKWDTTTIRSEAADTGLATAALRRDRRFDVSRYQPRLCFYAAEGNC